MPKTDEIVQPRSAVSTGKLPVSVIVAVRNEEKNLPRCLEALRDAGEVYVIDSQSVDATPEIARSFGAKVIQFHYQGGWPKKRQWAIDTLPLNCAPLSVAINVRITSSSSCGSIVTPF